MSRQEDLLRSTYHHPADTYQLQRMTTLVRQISAPPPPHRQPRRWATPLSIAATVAVVATGTVLVVTTGHGHDRSAASTTTTATTASTPSTAPPTTKATRLTVGAHIAMVTAQPAFGSRNLSPLQPFQITATSGQLQHVVITDAYGNEVTGAFSADLTSWKSTGPLAYGTVYHVTGSAQGSDHTTVPIEGTLTTLSPIAQAAATVHPAPGSTVGVGQPVSLSFPAGLDPTERATIQHRLTLTTSVPVTGAWGWAQSGDNTWRVDWRPAIFWPANTRVHLQANLFGVQLTPGTYAKADVTTDFTVGRSQQVTLDGARQRLIISRPDSPVVSYPAQIPTSLNSGTFTVLSTSQTLMERSPGAAKSATSRWVLRISSNGEFIEAPLSDRAQDTSVRMSIVDAKAFFDQTIVGDPVQVRNTGNALLPTDDNDNDWAYTWAQWQKLSAQ